MGLFDSVVGGMMGQLGGGAVQDMITKALQGGGLAGFDLNSLADKMRQNGFGDIVDSWIGTGANKAISPDQIGQALGPDAIAQVAQKFGIDPAMIMKLLAEHLPSVVDKLTPNGKLPG